MSRFSLLLLCVVLTAGCVRGDRYIAESHEAYNEALRTRFDEELLLNLVRLRYRDRPLFLQVSSVIGRFVRNQSFGIGDSFTGGRAGRTQNVVGVDLDFSFSEQPTVTFTPLQGEDFSERLMRPIDLDTIALLQRSGWSIERVLRLTVQRMNGLDNAAGASGPTPAKAPEFREFVSATRSLKQLQDRRAVVIGSEVATRDLSEPIPADGLTAAHVLAAAKNGQRFVPTSDGAHVVLRSSRSRWVLRLASTEQNEEVTNELRSTLGLRQSETSYDLQSAVGEVQDILGEAGNRGRIVVVTRSLLGVLFFLCHAVDIPQRHIDEGLVTTTVTADDEVFSWSEVTDGLLRIRTTPTRPANAAVAVQYRHYWFSIDDNDLGSKSTFALLAQLYALQAGDPVAGSAPVPTLPL